MAIDSLLVSRFLILLLGLIAFYKILTLNHLVKKALAWLVFQISVILPWLSSSYRYHGQSNPLPQTTALLIGVLSMGTLGVMLIFALGVFRRHDTFEVEKNKFKGLS